MNEPQSAQPRLFGDRMLEHMPLIWAVIFYATMALGLATVLLGEQPLVGPRLLAASALCAGSAALFQRLYRREPDCPMRPSLARRYFTAQLFILAGLLALSDAFIGFGYVLMGQTLGALRPRWWVLVLVPLLGLLAGPMGWVEAAARAEWVGLATFGLITGISVLIGVLLSVLFGQRFQLLGLVAELRQARAELETTAAQGEELAVLRERTRLAREMHDSLGHALVAVNVKLEVAQRLYRLDVARGDGELEATRELVRATMGELRRSIADLRAPDGDHHAFPATLRRLATEVSSRGVVSVTVAIAPDEALPPPPVAEALFLIAREALVNVERHARARRATLALRRAGDEWCLEVADDGVGVRPSDLRKPGHFGVVGMRERADALGGQLELSARAEGGTLLVAHIPDTTMVAV